MLNHTMIESPTSSLQDESEDMDSNNHVRLTALTVRIEGNSKQQPLQRDEFCSGLLCDSKAMNVWNGK